MSSAARYLALIPAAGSGSRLGGPQPKQYLPLAGRALIQHTVERLCRHPRIAAVFVVLSHEDSVFRTLDWGDDGGWLNKLQPLYCGGSTRAASVLNGLSAAYSAFEDDDWVLVHDAARPCLSEADLDRLLDETRPGDDGSLLAVPVADTLKRAGEDGQSSGTVSRQALWRAQTPQMFRYAALLDALQQADLAQVTDEAAAMELRGVRPRLVRGSETNLKVTYAQDLELAGWILRGRDGK
jgi:2-C-methyl-D-erythritol 4-phosphate cytidylyltransferase